MAKRFICDGCDILNDNTQNAEMRQSLLPLYCYATFYQGSDQEFITCNRRFLSEKFFQNHLTLKVKGKLRCHWRQGCRNCSYFVTADSKHECLKKFCIICNKKQTSGHFCYVAPLKPNKLSETFLYVFFDTECTQDLENCDGPFKHVQKLICAQQIRSKCEAVDDLSVECDQC